MNRDDPRSGEYLVKAFESLLAQHPTAPVGAIDDHGLYAPVPGSIELGSRAVLPGRSALDLVVPADRVIAIDAWGRGRDHGAARVSVRLRGSPDRAVVMELFDLRESHGVLMVVIIGADKAAELVGLSDAPPIAPRLAVQRKNDVAVITGIDEAFTQMLGWKPEEAIGSASLDMVHPEDQDRAIETWMEMLAVPGSTRRVRLRHRRSDESWVWVEITNKNLLDDPDEQCVIAEVLDVSDEVAAHEAVRAREQLLRRIAETIPLGLVQVDRDGSVVYSNERFSDIVGSGTAEKVQDLLGCVVHDEWTALEDAMREVLSSGRDVDMEVSLHAQHHGRDRQCRLSLRALTSGSDVTGAIACVEDVTESVRMRVELESRATYDDLTGCLNRRSVMAALEDALADGGRVGVVFVDLDGFKEVNDALGHAVGDDLLVAVSDRLRSAVRDRDVVGRLGGDEFLVVCPGTDNPEEVLAIAGRVEVANSDALILGSEVVAARASIGVAVSGPSSNASSVVADADLAMYESKRRALGAAVLCTDDLRAAGDARPHSMHVRRR